MEGGSNSNNNTPNNTPQPPPLTEAADWDALLQLHLVGLPMLISYDSAWACARLRYQVFLNSLRLFHPDSPFRKVAGAAVAEGNVVEQFRLSTLLDLHLCLASGVSAVCNPPVTTAAGAEKENSKALAAQMHRIWVGAAYSAEEEVSQEENWMMQCDTVGATQAKQREGRRNVPQCAEVEALFGSSVPNSKTMKIGESRVDAL